MTAGEQLEQRLTRRRSSDVPARTLAEGVRRLATGAIADATVSAPPTSSPGCFLAPRRLKGCA